MSPQLGYRREWIIYDADKENKRIICKSIRWGPSFASRSLLRWLSETDIGVVLAAGMGHRLRQSLAQQGIKVVLLVRNKAPESLVLEYFVENPAAVERAREDRRCVDEAHGSQ